MGHLKVGSTLFVCVGVRAAKFHVNKELPAQLGSHGITVICNCDIAERTKMEGEVITEKGL